MAKTVPWAVPDEVTMIALPARTRCVRAELDMDVLADLGVSAGRVPGNCRRV